MQGMWTPRVRPERLIGAARVVLAVFTLFAVWLDPTEPDKYAELAYGLMVAYLAYAGIVAAVVWRLSRLSRAWPIVTHAIDLLFFSLFIFFTSGPGSPFNVYFVFALVCATIRWQLTGTLWTAAVALTVVVGYSGEEGWSCPTAYASRTTTVSLAEPLGTKSLLGCRPEVSFVPKGGYNEPEPRNPSIDCTPQG